MTEIGGCSTLSMNSVWLGAFWVTYIIMGCKKVTGKTCFWPIPGVKWWIWPPPLITSFRVDCTKFLDYTGHRRIFWKRLGHRPCLSWMYLPRIAQNLTQCLVKSDVVSYNKQTKVHTVASLTSWPLFHIANVPSPYPPTSSPYPSHTSTLTMTQISAQIILSFMKCPSTLWLPKSDTSFRTWLKKNLYLRWK